jgi:large subunit ribosomal protein L23
VSILKTIVDAVGARRRERPVCIFDLDGTLYENRPRTLRILHAVAASLESEHRDDASAILALSWQDLAYRVEDTLRPRGVSEVVIERCVAAWRKKFFTDTACSDDIPQRGAVRFVRQCYDRGATVVYLTGRDIPGMLVGTVRTLRDDGRLAQVLVAPIVSEKATSVAEKHNQVMFKVLRDATKPEIKAAVELLFKVEVQGVTVINQKGKTKRFGGRIGRRDHAKKAYVSLKPGQELNFSGEVS